MIRASVQIELYMKGEKHMTVKRRIDDQGRIIIPNHMRKDLNLVPGTLVEVSMDEDKTITVRLTADNCCICGKSLEGKDTIKVTKDKTMCFSCAEKVAQVI